MRARLLVLGVLGVAMLASCKPRSEEPGTRGAETGATPDTSMGGAVPADTGMRMDTSMQHDTSMGQTADSIRHGVDSATRP